MKLNLFLKSVFTIYNNINRNENRREATINLLKTICLYL